MNISETDAEVIGYFSMCVLLYVFALCCRVFQFSDDEEETRRVVRSEKDKR